MKYLTYMLAVLVLLGVVALSSMSVSGQVPEQEPEKEKMNEAHGIMNDVKLSVRLPAKNVAGRPVLLEITLLNQSKQSVGYSVITGYGEWGIVVKDNQRQVVPRTRFGQTRIRLDPDMRVPTSKLSVKSLAPRKSVSLKFNLARLYDLTEAGTYTVTAQHIVNENMDEPFTVKTEPLAFEIIEPTPEKAPDAPDKPQ